MSRMDNRMIDFTKDSEYIRMYGKKRVGIRIFKRILIYSAFVSSIISASCLVYVVMWLEALRKGWLI
jgi:hypothetical protein